MEEKVRDLGGNFVYNRDGSNTYMTVDSNVLTGQNDNSFDLLTKTFCLSLIKDSF